MEEPIHLEERILKHKLLNREEETAYFTQLENAVVAYAKAFASDRYACEDALKLILKQDPATVETYVVREQEDQNDPKHKELLASIRDTLHQANQAGESTDWLYDALTMKRPSARFVKSSYKLLANVEAPEEYKALLDQAYEEVIAASHKIHEKNYRLVNKQAQRYARMLLRDNPSMDTSDLFQSGNIGLMEAIDRFDYTRENKFSTYATWWIRQSITRAFSNEARSIRLPVHLAERLGKLGKARSKLTNDLGRTPTREELAQVTQITPSRIDEYLQMMQVPESLSKPIGDDDASMEDLIGTEVDHSIPIFKKQTLAAINSVLDTLKPREAYIMRLRFNLPLPRAYSGEEIGKILDVGGKEIITTFDLSSRNESLSPTQSEIMRLAYGVESTGEHTLEQVGEVLSLTRERIRQIVDKTLRKLRHPSRKLRRLH